MWAGADIRMIGRPATTRHRLPRLGRVL